MDFFRNPLFLDICQVSLKLFREIKLSANSTNSSSEASNLYLQSNRYATLLFIKETLVNIFSGYIHTLNFF